MDEWFVRIKGCGGDGGGVSYFAEKGIVSILSEESKCRLVITVRARAPSAAGRYKLDISRSGAHGVGSLRDAVYQMHW